MHFSPRPTPVPAKSGQESVWDYPRPPRVELSPRHIRIMFNGIVLADSSRTWRVLETSHPPIYYIPPADIQMAHLTATRQQSFCEFKGMAAYYSVVVGDRRADNATWYYPQPSTGYEAIRGCVAFYAALMDACYVDDEQVTPQPGGFYGGWITSDVVGPFKGDPRYNSRGW